MVCWYLRVVYIYDRPMGDIFGWDVQRGYNPSEGTIWGQIGYRRVPCSKEGGPCANIADVYKYNLKLHPHSSRYVFQNCKSWGPPFFSFHCLTERYGWKKVKLGPEA